MTRNKEKGWGGMQVSNTIDFKGSKIYCNSVKKELISGYMAKHCI